MNIGEILGSAVAAIVIIMFAAGGALAHCDTLDGPVVSLARATPPRTRSLCRGGRPTGINRRIRRGLPAGNGGT